MKTRRLLTAITLSLALALAGSPALADWDNPPPGAPGSTPVDVMDSPMLEAAVLGFQMAMVAV